jgi:hypothetical protein
MSDPRERYVEKASAALMLIYKFGWSAPAVIDRFVSPNRSGFCSILKRQGLIKEAEAVQLYPFPSWPRKIYQLTSAGEAIARELNPSLADTRYKRSIRTRQIKHDFILQQILINQYEKHALLGNYMTTPELEAQTNTRAVPDLVAGKIALELELSRKSPCECDKVILRCMNSINSQVATRAVIVCGDEETRREFDLRLKGEKSVSKWTKLRAGRVRMRGVDVHINCADKFHTAVLAEKQNDDKKQNSANAIYANTLSYTQLPDPYYDDADYTL